MKDYDAKKEEIRKRLGEFRRRTEREMFNEFRFCLLTPQSNAQRCWSAVLELERVKPRNVDEVTAILATRTRFHHTKAKRILRAEEMWAQIRGRLDDADRLALRNFIAENVNGYGLKEAAHFLRNIGRSDNQIAILDRHILRNLKAEGVIEDEKIKSRKQYLEVEQKFLDYSKRVGILADELDLLWWSRENGEIFK